MKNFLKNPNVLAVVQLIISIAETIVLIFFTSCSVWLAVLMEIAALMAICMFRFSYRFAKWNNRWHSLWYRKNAVREGDDEPSDIAVAGYKIGSGIVLVLQTFVLLIFAMLV